MLNHAECRVIFPLASLNCVQVRDAIQFDTGISPEDLAGYSRYVPRSGVGAIALEPHEVPGLLVLTDQWAPSGAFARFETALRCTQHAYDAETLGGPYRASERRFWRPGMGDPGVERLDHAGESCFTHAQLRAVFNHAHASAQSDHLRAALAGLLTAVQSEIDPILDHATDEPWWELVLSGESCRAAGF